MKRVDLERHLRDHGCEFHHHGKSHDFWYRPDTLVKTPVPRHREVKKGTVRSICRALDVPVPHNP